MLLATRIPSPVRYGGSTDHTAAAVMSLRLRSQANSLRKIPAASNLLISFGKRAQAYERLLGQSYLRLKLTSRANGYARLFGKSTLPIKLTNRANAHRAVRGASSNMRIRTTLVSDATHRLFAASRMAIRTSVRTDFFGKVFGGANMAIRLNSWAVYYPSIRTGDAWANFSFEVHGEGGQVNLGGLDINLAVGEWPGGEYRPAVLNNVQQNGIVTFVLVKPAYTDSGKPIPMIRIPGSAEDGGGQISFMLAGGGSNLVPQTELMEMLIGFLTGGQNAANGVVITHPKMIIVRFFLPPDEPTIVAVPPVVDWGPIKARSGVTPQAGDIEYFELSSGSGGVPVDEISALGTGWK